MSDQNGFVDRRDAGRQLAAALRKFAKTDSLVLALPRGGVPVAYEVSKALGLPLDVLIVRKIGAPHHAEFGIGAVVDGADPQIVLNEEAIRILKPEEAYMKAEIARQLVEIERRRAAYLGPREPLPTRGRTVIVVDDGIATGGTVRAALQALRRAGAGKLVLAVPVAPAEALESLREDVDEIVCLQTPGHFGAVGLHYDHFEQTSDEEVVSLLQPS